MKPNIMETVVAQDRCIGCGVCDTICPVNVLNMDFNASGMYQPFESDGCLDKCTLCLDVCPFVETNKGEQEIAKSLYANGSNVNFHKDLGYFVNTYEMHKHDDPDRFPSASGGAGHWVLSALLENKKVDHILSVEPNDDPDRLFKFSVFDSVAELNRVRGSVYYPTELSEVLDYIMEHEGTYAITVLPCYAKAIRLAQAKNHKLRKRIKFLIGLVCGQMKSTKFTTELAKKAIGSATLGSVKYRVKQPDQPASNFAFEFKGEDGSVGRLSRTAQSDGVAPYWSNRLFTPMVCNSCTDVFALDADLVLMDAWLPEYIKDYRGHTLIIVRTNELDEMVREAKSISVKSIDYQKVFQSQKGVVQNKTYFAKGTYNPIKKSITLLKIKVQELSHEDTWSEATTAKYIKYIRVLEKVNILISHPRRSVKQIINKLLNFRKVNKK